MTVATGRVIPAGTRSTGSAIYEHAHPPSITGGEQVWITRRCPDHASDCVSAFIGTVDSLFVRTIHQVGPPRGIRFREDMGAAFLWDFGRLDHRGDPDPPRVGSDWECLLVCDGSCGHPCGRSHPSPEGYRTFQRPTMAKNPRLTEQSVQHTAEAVRVGGLSPSAIRHRFGQPPVRLTWTRTGDTVEFQVTDAGSGPDPDLAGDRLFGDWGKGGDDETMTPGMGTRLGLLQARLLTGLSGGELTLHRTDTEWAFTMRISEPSSITPRRGEASSRRQTPVATSQDRGPRAKSPP